MNSTPLDPGTSGFCAGDGSKTGYAETSEITVLFHGRSRVLIASTAMLCSVPTSLPAKVPCFSLGRLNPPLHVGRRDLGFGYSSVYIPLESSG